MKDIGGILGVISGNVSVISAIAGVISGNQSDISDPTHFDQIRHSRRLTSSSPINKSGELFGSPDLLLSTNDF
ncbi:hypothetical protein [Alteribacter populi]|uniref:hypothetical protein n=1 Tax=Alteribacter populi TaxID=2011011 RepID=UPI000C2C9CC8|nr:hypothetical protein [Alteribacter populi]